MKLTLALILLLIQESSLSSTLNHFEHRNSSHYVIDNLVELFQNDDHLTKQFRLAFSALPENSEWYGKNIDNFYSFFEEWLYYNPKINSPKEYTDKFKAFYFADIPNSRRKSPIHESIEAVTNPKFIEWLKIFVEARGTYLDSSDSLEIVQEWLNDESIRIEDYKIPENGFSSFNDFFTRELKENVRPIYKPNNPSALTSPADCIIWKIQIGCKEKLKLK